MTKTLRFMMAMLMTAMTSVMMAATATWHYEWNTTKQNGGEGFYNFGSSFVDFDDYLTTTINGLTWHATATGTKKFAMTATGGQTIGTGTSDNATHAAFWTDDITGKVKEVKVNARLNKAEYAGTVSVRVGDVVLGTQALSNEPTEYSFTTTADAEGTIEISLDQTSETRGTLYLKAVTIVYEVEEAYEEADWYFNWNKSRTDEGAEGFYNFGSVYVDEPQLTTTLNGLNWTYFSPETNYASYTAKMGQAFGKPSAYAQTVTLSTSDLAGKVTTIKVKARENKAEQQGRLSVKVNDMAYLCEGEESVLLTEDSVEYAFTTATPQEGKIEIIMTQGADNASTLYMKSIGINYLVEKGGVPAPVFSPDATNAFNDPQTVNITVDGLDSADFIIYYTTDGSNPRIEASPRQVYTGPIAVSQTTTLKAVTLQGEAYSKVTEATYKIRKDPTWSLEFPDNVTDRTYVIEYPDNAVGPWLNNPDNIEVAYSSGDESVVYVDKYGDLWSAGVGETRIWVYNLASDEWKFKLEEYYVNVVEKEPLAMPTVSPMGGTFSAPVDVTVSTDDERAYTIWYSTTANDFDELTDDPTIIPEKSGTIHIDHTCRLLLVTAGYNVFSPLVDLQFTIDESTGIRAVDDNQPAKGSRLCDLQGRQVSTKHKGKGLYIRNGKKIIVK